MIAPRKCAGLDAAAWRVVAVPTVGTWVAKETGMNRPSLSPLAASATTNTIVALAFVGALAALIVSAVVTGM